ncbi:MAG: hypothetical protein U0441_22085 [Polyangiaceae bacterium]
MKRRRTSLTALQRGLVRLAFAFVATFLTSSYVASIVHMAFVAHATCAEHGGFVHVQSAAPDGPSLRGDRSSPSTLPGGAITADEHDHCLVGATRPGESHVARAGLSVLIDGQAPSAAPPVEAPFASPDVGPPPQIALLFLSPMNSPPA